MSTFLKNIIFFDRNGPLPNVMFRALYFKHSLLNWGLKFMEITERLQNCIFYRTNSSNYSSEVVKKLIEKLSKSTDFSAHDFLWENVIFWVCAAWSYFCLQIIQYLLKKNVSSFLYSLQLWCLRYVQNFILVPLMVLNLLKTVYDIL